MGFHSFFYASPFKIENPNRNIIKATGINTTLAKQVFTRISETQNRNNLYSKINHSLLILD